MKNSHLLSAAIVGLMVTGVQAADPEYKNECTMGLATKKHIPTDCSVTWQSEDRIASATKRPKRSSSRIRKAT